MLTVWIALSDAPIERGCLQVTPGSHRQALRTTVRTYRGARWPSPTPYGPGPRHPRPGRSGDVILMHKHTIHGFLPNLSDEVRWSLELRYNPTGQPTGRPEFLGFVARSWRNPAS